MSYKPKRDLTAARLSRVYEPFPELANLFYAVERLCVSPPADRERVLAEFHVAAEIFATARAAHRAPWQRLEDLNVIRRCTDRLNSFVASENARRAGVDRVAGLWLPRGSAANEKLFPNRRTS